MSKKQAPYGTWPSDLSGEVVAGAALRFGLVRTDNDGTIYWSEGRPAEKGRCPILRQTRSGDIEELLPPPFSARSKVHEYGGGEFTISNGTIFFVNADDQDIYKLIPGQDPERITDDQNMRFADIVWDTKRNRLIAVVERQPNNGHHHPENFIASISLEDAPSAAITPIVDGQDFFAKPTINEEGRKIAWLAWDLPDMPWDSASLYVADMEAEGSVGTSVQLAGDSESAVFQPEWQDNKTLTFVWDKSGWANLYSWNGEAVTALDDLPIDCSRPQWIFGMRSYAHGQQGIGLSAFVFGKCAFEEPGAHPWDAEAIQPSATKKEDWEFAKELRSFDMIAASGKGFAGLATSDFMAPAVVKLTQDKLEIIRDSSPEGLSPASISAGKQVQFKNAESEGVYGLYYPPTNAAYEGAEGEKPPILFTVHGGPTGMGDRGLKLKTQYWTSRGFGIFDTDYSGSTGYGRSYMNRLDGKWGLKDVSDIVDAANHLVNEGIADKDKLFITGSSAGGMTVLLALADHDVFAGGTCTYGVTDLSHLLKFTHKFEAGYLYRLLGIALGDDDNEELILRSPVSKAGKITKPVIFFQGLEDKVVPPEQSRRMVETLKNNGIPVEYYEFEGEGHGFRQASTIKAQLEKEQAFYAKILAEK